MRIIVAGATGQIGDFLLPMLLKQGHEVFAISRSEHKDEKVCWLQCDLNDAETVQLPVADVLINVAGLTLIPALAGQIRSSGIRRLIAFSSTSIFTKSESSDAREKAMINALKQAESEVISMCEKQGIGWTLFRPTLIYSLGRDKNITLIDEKIRRFHLFPLVGSGRGLRQPVHASDLATACLQVLDSEKAEGCAYNLSGGEVLSYKEMVKRLFEYRELPPRLIPVPAILLRFVIKLLRLLPKYRYLSPDMADRMEKDMVFSHEQATADFGYSPRTFQP